MEDQIVFLGVQLSDWIQIAVLVVLIFSVIAAYRLVKPAVKQAASSEAQIEASQRPCLIPRQFPQYNPQIEDLVREADESGAMTLQIENVGNGPAINPRLRFALPGKGYPEPEGSPFYRGPFALNPRDPLDTKIHVLDLGSRGPQRLLIYYESVTGRGYWTSADIFGPGEAGSVSITNLEAGKSVRPTGSV